MKNIPKGKKNQIFHGFPLESGKQVFAYADLFLLSVNIWMQLTAQQCIWDG